MCPFFIWVFHKIKCIEIMKLYFLMTILCIYIPSDQKLSIAPFLSAVCWLSSSSSAKLQKNQSPSPHILFNHETSEYFHVKLQIYHFLNIIIKTWRFCSQITSMFIFTHRQVNRKRSFITRCLLNCLADIN
jgi:hypothetical protein